MGKLNRSPVVSARRRVMKGKFRSLVDVTEGKNGSKNHTVLVFFSDSL